MAADDTLQALQPLAQRKTNATISIAADLANNNLNSICRFALSWINNGKVQGLSYLIKPPTDEFTFRKVTPDIVADRPSFADLWDSEIRVLLHESLLSAYHSEHIFLAIKASYEASGRPFVMEGVYIRDLQFLAVTYLADLGNPSFTSIMHYMKIPVDLDTDHSYLMLRGTYILPNKEYIPDFLQAVKDQDVGKIRTMVRADKVLVFAGPTQIQVTGNTESNGFVPVKVLNGDYADTTGYAPYTMISQQ